MKEVTVLHMPISSNLSAMIKTQSRAEKILAGMLNRGWEIKGTGGGGSANIVIVILVRNK